MKATFLGSSGVSFPVLVGVPTSSLGGGTGFAGLAGSAVALVMVYWQMSSITSLNLSRASLFVIIEVWGSNVGVG